MNVNLNEHSKLIERKLSFFQKALTSTNEMLNEQSDGCATNASDRMTEGDFNPLNDENCHFR